MPYIDTCVLVAAYCPEPLSAAAERAMRKDGPPAISPLCEVEFCSALALKTRLGGIDAGAAGRLLSCFRMHLAAGQYRIVPLLAGEYALACEWISRFDTPLRTGDALHLAAAFSSGLALVTSDRGLARSAKRLGVRHRLIS